LLRFGRALSWVAVATTLVVLLGSGTLWAYVSYINSKIKSVDAFCLGAHCYARPGESGSTENFLLVGSDTRAGNNSTGALAGLGNGSAGYGLSDTTMLVHLSANSSRVVILSFPRDMLVQTPAYTTSSGQQVSATSNKFNAAYALGGPKLLVQQVEQLSGLRVDHYVSVDFSGFEGIVNALGGVTVCLSQAAYDPGGDGSGGSGFRSPAGNIKLSGFRALQYVRQRHGLPRGDLDRIERQHRFLAAIFRKVKSAGTLLNPLKLNAVANAVASDITKDKKTSLDDLVTLASHIGSFSGDSIEFFTVPTSGGPQLAGLGAVLYTQRDAARALFQQIHDDQDPAHPTAKPTPKASPTASAVPTVTLAPSLVSLTVQNGTGITGKGRTAADALTALGFRVGSVGTAATSGQTQTTVRYGSGRADSAKTVAAAVPGSVLQEDPTLGSQQLILVVGTSYHGVQQVKVSGATTTPSTTAPSASASATPAVTKPDTTAGGTTAGNCGP
jgi:LCP family protein required for cell wall assembly